VAVALQPLLGGEHAVAAAGGDLAQKVRLAAEQAEAVLDLPDDAKIAGVYELLGRPAGGLLGHRAGELLGRSARELRKGRVFERHERQEDGEEDRRAHDRRVAADALLS